jgi:hypothetical protein
MDTRLGKVARLPYAIREEVNLRLLDRQTASKILPWLNSLPEVKAIIEEDFEGLLINDENLSRWRTGGFQEWLKKRDRVQETQELARWSAQLGKAAGGDMGIGSSAIISGGIMEVLERLREMLKPVEGESAEDGGKKLAGMAEALNGLALSVARLRKGDHSAAQLQLMRERLDQTGEELKLAQQKFQRETCALFLKWSRDERAKTILSGEESNDVKTEQLGQLIFQDDWQ